MFPGRTPLARKNLTHNVRRLLIALCGIGFAVVLMFVESGFESALVESAVRVIDKINADIIIVSKAEYYLLANETFSRQRLYQARSYPGVEAAYPLYIESFIGTWKPPDAKANPIRVFGFDPDDPVFNIPEINENAAALRAPESALVDRLSKKKFEIPETPEAMRAQRGVELCGRSIRLAGSFSLGTDFANDGNVVVSADNFARYFPFRAGGGDPLSRVDVGVVHVDDKTKAKEIAAGLGRYLPDDVKVFTKEDFAKREAEFWRKSTPVGFIFRVGQVVGFLVGVVICYQVIYAGISDTMSEFATLKAMGYRNRYFIGVVLTQSLYLSVLSFLPGMAVSMVLYRLLEWATGLTMTLGFWLAVIVFAATTLMCVVSGCLAIRKVLAADPAELF